MDIDNTNGLNNTSKAPRGLIVLVVLTLINTGFSVLSALFSLFRKAPTIKELQGGKVEMAKSIIELKNRGMDSMVSFMEQIQAMTEAMQPFYIQSNIVNVFIFACGAISAILMYRRKSNGFHLYIIYNLAAAGSLYLFISPSLVPTVIVVTNLILSFVFVLLYARHLLWIRGEY